MLHVHFRKQSRKSRNICFWHMLQSIIVMTNETQGYLQAFAFVQGHIMLTKKRTIKPKKAIKES